MLPDPPRVRRGPRDLEAARLPRRGRRGLRDAGDFGDARHFGFGTSRASTRARWPSPTRCEPTRHRRCRTLGAQEREHRQHAAVVLAAGGRWSFVKMLVTCFSTARSVTNIRSAIAPLERPSAISSSTSRSRGVSSASGSPRAPPADELRDDRRVERRAALGDAAHGRAELVEVGHAVLEQVADALRAVGEQLQRVARSRRTARARARRCSRCFSRISFAARRPSSVCVGGIRMSTIATSGLYERTLSSRSSAFPAWPTTSKPPSSSSRAIPSRRSTESSASTTRTPTGFAPPSSTDGSLSTPQRREVGAEPGREELEDPLRAGQAAQLVLAEVAQLGGLRERVRGVRRRAGSGRRARPRRSAPRGARRRRSTCRRRPTARRCGCRSGRAGARRRATRSSPSECCAATAARPRRPGSAKPANSSSPRQSTSWPPAASTAPRSTARTARSPARTRRRAGARARSTPRRRRRGA